MKDDLFIFTNKYTMRVLIGGNMQKIPVDLPDTLWLQGYFADYANPKPMQLHLFSALKTWMYGLMTIFVMY